MENLVLSLSKDGRALQPWFYKLTRGGAGGRTSNLVIACRRTASLFKPARIRHALEGKAKACSFHTKAIPQHAAPKSHRKHSISPPEGAAAVGKRGGPAALAVTVEMKRRVGVEAYYARRQPSTPRALRGAQRGRKAIAGNGADATGGAVAGGCRRSAPQVRSCRQP